MSLDKLFAKPEINTDWATPNMLEEVKLHLQNFEGRREILRKGYSENLQFAIGWIIHRMDSAKVAAILNSLYADDEYLAVIVGKLAIRLEMGGLPVTSFYYEEIKSDAAYQIITTMLDLSHIRFQDKLTQERDEDTGKVIWKTQRLLTFGKYVDLSESMYVKGIHEQPGTVMQKRFKVRAGGKALKLNADEKNYLKASSSVALRIIDIDPEEVRRYLIESEWYQSALKDPKETSRRGIDSIILNDIVRQQVEKFKLLQQLDHFYLSMWMDYRTRLYYDLTEMGFNPHGKTFETSLFELAEPEIINEEGADALMYSAVCIIDGRTPHHTAIENYLADPEHYIAALQKDKGDQGKNLYNARLAQALVDYTDGTPSHFLASEDATNGGLQHGGIGFKSEKMMIASNVGGSDHQEDSHGWLQQKLGLLTRDDAKAIHQPLLHGSTLKTISLMIDMDMEATRFLLEEAYGKEVFNIAAIAEWGVAVATNENPSLVWKTRDNFRAQSVAYTESVPIDVYALTHSTVKKYSQTRLHKEMPIFKDAKGQPVYGMVGEDKTQGKLNKLRGLYANITHSIDATALRQVGRALHDKGTGGMFKHDNFLTHPNHVSTVRKAYKAALLEEFDDCGYQAAIDDIVDAFDGSKPIKPQLFMGTATKDLIEKSHYFLSA